MSDGHLTLSERFDRMEAALEDIRRSAASLATHDAADQQRLTSLDRRVSAVESWQTWALRVIVGALLAGGVTAAGLLVG